MPAVQGEATSRHPQYPTSTHSDGRTVGKISPILWQNPNGTITLLDIPHSISNAQGCHAGRLISSPPALSAFLSNEPKSASAKAKLERNAIHSGLHAEYASLLRDAIEDVAKHRDGDWCLPRYLVEAPSSKKRRLNNEQTSETNISRPDPNHIPLSLPNDLLPSLALGNARTNRTSCSYRTCHVPNQSTASRQQQAPNAPSASEFESNHFFSNETDVPTVLQVISKRDDEIFSFHVPARSSCYLAPCASRLEFHSAIREQASEAQSRRHFDFVLLDPPWPNRSVRRTHQTPGSTYNTSPSLWDLRDLVLGMDLDVLMADECLVAIWITNKPAVREFVLGEDGIFACWGPEPVEEWVWLKTTVHGEPVTPLGALWRKPYEVMLLGRRRRAGLGQARVEEGSDVQRRVIVAVPDMHSRKPCLKELIEPLMRDRTDYRALEVFARHLVNGWWSWGDECIKFNWESYWQNDTDLSRPKMASHCTSIT